MLCKARLLSVLCVQKGEHAEHTTIDLNYADDQQIVSSNPACLRLHA